MSLNKSDPTKPDWHRPELVAAIPDLELVHDLLGGTRAMHARNDRYIRKWKNEKQDHYDIRSKIETVFEGTERTLSAAVGMLFAQDPVIEWNQSETALSPHWESIDGAGTKGDVFIKRFSDASVRDGLGVILVSHPSPLEGVQVTAENEDRLGLRPLWATYSRARAINWRTATVNNRTTLTMLVLEEPSQEKDQAFGVKTVVRYRVLSLDTTGDMPVARWRVWRKIDNPSGGGEPTFKPEGEGGTFMNRRGVEADFIPAAIAYTGRTNAPFTATIPLLGVAWANLSHWRQSSNLTYYRELAAFPQPLIEGELKKERDGQGNEVPGRIRVGPGVVIEVQEGGRFSWVELSGSALEQVRQGVQEKLEQMGQLGISFLTPDKRAAETAEAKRLDAVAETSTLATAATGIQDAVNTAWKYHAWYMGIDEAAAPKVSIGTDFEATTMSPAVMKVYLEAVDKAGLPVRLLLEAWQEGGRIHPDADLDDLEMEMLAGQAARQAALAAAAAANPLIEDPAANGGGGRF